MRSVLLAGVLLLSTWGGLTRIHDRNEAAQRGARAYARREYAAAAQAYRQAALSLGAQGEAIWLNLAHATARAGQATEARGYYNRLLASKDAAVRSVALQQLATLAAQKQDYAQALGLLRQALVADPANSDARHNYELLRDYLARRTAQPQLPPPGADGNPGADQSASSASKPRPGPTQQGQLDDPSQPQNPRSAPQAQADARGQRDPAQPSATPGRGANGFQPGAGNPRNVARGNQPGSVRGLSDEETGPEATTGASRRGGTEAASTAESNVQTQRARLQQMNISAGQARQILEALHAAEQQYLQQLPRKASKPISKGKPGW